MDEQLGTKSRVHSMVIGIFIFGIFEVPEFIQDIFEVNFWPEVPLSNQRLVKYG